MTTDNKPTPIKLHHLGDQDDHDRRRRHNIARGHVAWGRWKFNPTLLTLEHTKHRYAVNLSRMHDSASVLDWIAQVANKVFFTPADVGDFVRAVNELVPLQATCCGGGTDREFDMRKVYPRPSLRPAFRPRTPAVVEAMHVAVNATPTATTTAAEPLPGAPSRTCAGAQAPSPGNGAPR